VRTQDKTTAIYVRTAVHDRTGGQSLATQEQACRTYAAALGWRVGEAFSDSGIAGTRRDRPGLSRLLAAMRDGTIERVVIARPDRLSRSHADIRTIVHVLEEWGVQCESVEQPGYLQAPQLTENE
jgi:site-specific DNA recombinase